MKLFCPSLGVCYYEFYIRELNRPLCQIKIYEQAKTLKNPDVSQNKSQSKVYYYLYFIFLSIF